MKTFLIAIVACLTMIYCINFFRTVPTVSAQTRISPQQLWQMNQAEKQRLNQTLQQLNRNGGNPRDYAEAYRQFNYNITQNGIDYGKGLGMPTRPNPVPNTPVPVPQQPTIPQPYNLNPGLKGAIGGFFQGR